MRTNKFLILSYLTILSFYLNAQKKNEKASFYSDTAVESNGYKIGLTDTYVRKKLFLRTTVVITNPTDKFLLIDKDNIIMSTGHIKGKAPLYHRIIVVPPGEIVKFPLKYTAKDCESSIIWLNFSGLKVTNLVVNKHAEKQMLLEEKNETLSDGIRITVIRAELKDEGLAVRLRIQYEGTYFLGHNLYAISLLSPKQDSCFNFRKYKSKSYINPNRNNELVWLVFPRECAKATSRLERTLVFKDVFTEYSTKPIPDTKLFIRYLPGLKKNIEDEKEKTDETND
jgi:hypothetical protein